jgi:acyl-CoA dehydrogenase
MEACRVMTAGAVDLQIRPSIVSAIAKYHMTEMSRKLINHAMDIHAGHAIQIGPRNMIAPAYLAMPVSITVEGANILTRNLIVFGQGAIRCHPYVLQEVELFASDDPQRNEKLDKLLLSHIGYFVSNLVRTFCLGLTGGYLVLSPVRGPTARYYRQLTRMSSALALLSDAAMMLLGGNLKRKERLSARLGDILSELYLASTVLKFYKDQGQPASDLDSVKWSIELCLYNIQIACNELLENFPMRWLGKLLHFIVFPFGNAYRKPSDDLHQKVVMPMLSHSEFRDRVTQYCYVGKNADDPIKRLDSVMDSQSSLEPLLKKFQIALRSGKVPAEGGFNERVSAALNVGLLTADEAHALHEFEAIQREVIDVNEFSFDFSSVLN